MLSIVLLVLLAISFRPSFAANSTSSNSSDILATVQSSLEGGLLVEDISYAAEDFGGIYRYPPLAVVKPKTQTDIAKTVGEVFRRGNATRLSIAARGNAHSIQAQAQAHAGLVIDMRSLVNARPIRVVAQPPQGSYADVSGEQLWIEVLRETLNYNLTPRSWTDYIHLTVGGTLSNAGVSGQAFKYGPQISNVHQLEVVTGKGEIVTCSENKSADLFHAVLGGLGQFGIITRATIPLEPAPSKVKWITALYTDFSAFSKDQQLLISSSPATFDYIEGFVDFDSATKTPIFTLEVGKYFTDAESDQVNQTIAELLSPLRYIPSSLNITEVSYLEFLDRVHASEVHLRASGAWDVPHPWLNLMIPASQIRTFVDGVFGNIVTDASNGIIIIYPVNRSKWNEMTSVVVPDCEDVFYLVSILPTVLNSPSSAHDLDRVLAQNRQVLQFCKQANIPMKEYLPHYEQQQQWKEHFGDRWAEFSRRKSTYDPLAILGPSHKIFTRSQPIS